MTATVPDVVVIIVNWNTCGLLAECLDALQTHAAPQSLHIIVVDNASSDGSADMVRTRFPHVRLIALETNMGFVHGNNLAFAKAGDTRHVLLLNPDAIPCPGALARMTTFLDTHPRAGICGPLTLNPDGTLQPSWSRFPTVASELWGGHDRRFAGQSYSPELSLAALRALPNAPAVDWVSGACLLVRRAALPPGVPLLDPAFDMYSEETDLCLRLHRAGWTTHLFPQAEVVHHYGQSSCQAPARTLRLLYQSKFLFFRKHYGPVRTLALRASVALIYSLKWAAFALRGSQEPRARQWAILQSLAPQKARSRKP